MTRLKNVSIIGMFILSILAILSPVSAAGPTMSLLNMEAAPGKHCLWNMSYEAAGFAPNSSLYLSLPYVETFDCEGNPVYPGYADWNIGTTDNNGYLQFGFRHGEWGRYDYVLRDDYGNVATMTVNYNYRVTTPQQPTVTPVPTTRPSVEPTVAPTTAPPVEVTRPSTKCILQEFTGEPGRAAPGTRFTLRAKGDCVEGTRAMRIGVRKNGADAILCELGSTQIECVFDSTGWGNGGVTFFAVITNGSWPTAARAEFNLQLDSTQSPSGIERTQPVDNCHLINCSAPQSGGGSSGGSNNPSSNSNCAGLNTFLNPGDIAVVSDEDPDPLRVRHQPTTTSSVFYHIPIRELLTIVGGPICPGDGRVWYEIGYKGKGGFTAAVNTNGTRNLLKNGEPLPGSGSNGGSGNSGGNNGGSGSGNSSGSSPTGACGSTYHVNLNAGDTGRVTLGGVENNIRSGPGTSFPEIGEIPPGGQFKVLSEGDCGDGYHWLFVDYNGVHGWTATGDANGPWVEKVEGESEEASKVTVKRAAWTSIGDKTITDFSAAITYDVQNSYRVRTVTYLAEPSTPFSFCQTSMTVSIIDVNGNVEKLPTKHFWSGPYALGMQRSGQQDFQPYKDLGSKGKVQFELLVVCVPEEDVPAAWNIDFDTGEGISELSDYLDQQGDISYEKEVIDIP